MAKVKFKCISKMGIETFTLVLEPVAHTLPAKDDRDKNMAELAAGHGSVLHPDADRSFFAGYPHGSITLSAVTAKEAQYFEKDKEVWVHFTPVAEGE